MNLEDFLKTLHKALERQTTQEGKKWAKNWSRHFAKEIQMVRKTYEKMFKLSSNRETEFKTNYDI